MSLKPCCGRGDLVWHLWVLVPPSLRRSEPGPTGCLGALGTACGSHGRGEWMGERPCLASAGAAPPPLTCRGGHRRRARKGPGGVELALVLMSRAGLLRCPQGLRATGPAALHACRGQEAAEAMHVRSARAWEGLLLRSGRSTYGGNITSRAVSDSWGSGRHGQFMGSRTWTFPLGNMTSVAGFELLFSH